jgi:protein ImuB
MIQKRILYFKGGVAAAAMSALGEACFSLTPKVAVSPDGEIYLDIGSTQKVLGGEARTLMLAEGLTSMFGLVGSRTLVLTDRPEWARALARDPAAASGDVILPPGTSAERILKLPLAAVVDLGDPSTLATERPEREALISCIRDFAGLPAPAVSRRFGKSGLILREWVLGERELLLPPFVPEETIKESVDADELTSLDALLFLLQEALGRIEARLQGRACAAKRLKLTFNLESHAPLVKSVELSQACREAAVMLRVLQEFLSGVTWQSPLVRLEIEVVDMLTWQPGQLSLLDEMENRFPDLAEYVARLRARFGAGAVGFPSLRESHLPERSWVPVWPPEVSPPRRERYPERPLFLFNPPKLVSPPRHWNLTPSENLAVEWWEPGGSRQYFVAQDPRGECLWVYLDTQTREWFIQGTFD